MILPPARIGMVAAGGVLAALSLAGASAIVAQSPGGGPPPAPPPEAIAACSGKSDGAQCSVALPGGSTLAGQCHAPPGRALACIPEGGPPRGGPGGRGPGPRSAAPPPSDQGAAILATRADTSAVLCDLAREGTNSGLGLGYVARWSCADGERRLTGNGIPDHPVGNFPNPGNPNRIAARAVSFATTLTPVARSGAGAFTKIAGYALNGVKFDPGTAQSCDTQCADRGEGHGNPWRIEALGQNFFAFGVDDTNGHVQPGGAYHYHGIPEGMLSADARAGKAMALIGWAVDGFPVYARLGHADPASLASPLRAMRPSYRLKARPDPGRPPVDFAPLGTFTQDYEYVAGLGDLDECNGRTDVTPEFPKGIYHYYATDAFPFIQRCVKGTAAQATDDDGPPPGMRRGGRR